MAEGLGGLLGNFAKLDDPNVLYGGLLSDEATQRAINWRGLMSAVGSLGQSAMPSRLPIPLGGALGIAAGAMGPGEDAVIKARTEAAQGLLYGAQGQNALANIELMKTVNKNLAGGPPAERLPGQIAAPAPAAGGGGATTGGGGGGAAPGPGGISANQLYTHFVDDLGATPNEATLLTSAASNESSFRPDVTHDGGIGYGLWGHNGPRLASMRQSAGVDANAPVPWQQQAAFALNELRNRPEGKLVNSAKTADELTNLQLQFEQPKGWNTGGGNREGRLASTAQYLANPPYTAKPKDDGKTPNPTLAPGGAPPGLLSAPALSRTPGQISNALGGSPAEAAAADAAAVPPAAQAPTGRLPDILTLSGRGTQPADKIAQARRIAAGEDPVKVLGYDPSKPPPGAWAPGRQSDAGVPPVAQAPTDPRMAAMVAGMRQASAGTPVSMLPQAVGDNAAADPSLVFRPGAGPLSSLIPPPGPAAVAPPAAGPPVTVPTAPDAPAAPLRDPTPGEAAAVNRQVGPPPPPADPLGGVNPAYVKWAQNMSLAFSLLHLDTPDNIKQAASLGMVGATETAKRAAGQPFDMQKLQYESQLRQSEEANKKQLESDYAKVIAEQTSQGNLPADLTKMTNEQNLRLRNEMTVRGWQQGPNGQWTIDPKFVELQGQVAEAQKRGDAKYTFVDVPVTDKQGNIRNQKMTAEDAANYLRNPQPGGPGAGPVLYTPAQEEMQKGGAAADVKNAQTVTEQAQAANEQQSTVTLMRSAAPQIYTGPFATVANDFRRILTAMGASPDSAKRVADFEDFIKNSGSLVRTAVRQESSKAAVQEFQLIASALPNVENSQNGLQRVLGEYQGLNDYRMFKQQQQAAYTQRPGSSGTYDTGGFEAQFNNKYSPLAFVLTRMSPEDRQSVAAQVVRQPGGREQLLKLQQQIGEIQKTGWGQP